MKINLPELVSDQWVEDSTREQAMKHGPGTPQNNVADCLDKSPNEICTGNNSIPRASYVTI